jgi:DnaK suppressor protein
MDAERARELLATERSRIEEELRNLAPGERDDAPEDTGDEAAELYEAEFDTQLAEDLRTQLAAIARAEQRLANGTYGLSVESGKPIPEARLEAMPAAERTVEEQARFDTGA